MINAEDAETTRAEVAGKEQAGLGTPMEKGAGAIRTLFLFYNSIISFLTAHPDKFSNFIFSINSLAYAENRSNRGLTGFVKIEKWF